MARLHTPEEAAEQLRCTASWLKEQARLRKIPFTMLGGQYRFSDAHLDRIVALFEQLPEKHMPAAPRRRTTTPAATAGVAQLQARTPKRLRSTA